MRIHLPGLLLCVLLSTVFSSCRHTRYITERYIKTQIEEHSEGSFSSIRTFIIYQGATVLGSRYLELTGYKYKGTKALVIGADRIYQDRKNYKEDQTAIVTTEFIELNLAQAQSILDNYKILLGKMNAEKVVRYEAVYHDYTVSPSLFISYKKSRSNPEKDLISFWIKGEKYSVSAKEMIGRLRVFVKY